MTYRIITGDCIDGMRTLPDQCVHTIVTSPPYYGLRDYGTANWEGGDAACDHVESLNKHGGQRADRNQEGYKKMYKDVCGKCGAQRVDRQIGLEESPEAYVARLVAVFREARRILRDDGTLWLNLGDSYGQHKQLLGIPWRVAFALQADGWYLRQDIIWHKPNPMPESVTDRCTKAHEYIFLLSKSERYYYDHEAIREPNSPTSQTGGTFRNIPKYASTRKNTEKSAMRPGYTIPRNGRNRRSVWTVATRSYKGAHFATYPPQLIEPCILAGSPVGGMVFDPFNGSGTTGAVAIEHGRTYIGTELNPEYVKLTHARLATVQPRLLPKGDQ